MGITLALFPGCVHGNEARITQDKIHCIGWVRASFTGVQLVNSQMMSLEVQQGSKMSAFQGL